jgi:HlyD family secretion protein
MKKWLQGSKKKKALLWIAVVIVALGGIGLGAWKTGWLSRLGLIKENTAVTYQTTDVFQGDLTVSISGSGTVIAENSADLGFTVGGTLGTLNVQPGDQVTKGETLAVLAGLDQLEVAVQSADVAVKTAQKALDDLNANGAVEISQAWSDLAAAQTAFAKAQAGLHHKGDSRCAPALSEDYYFQWLDISNEVGVWEGYLADGGSGYGRDFILSKLETLRRNRDNAASNLSYCQSYTDLEIETSQAAYDLAKANMVKAQQTYDNAKANNGIDPVALQIAQANLDKANAQFTKAKNDLAGATIIAPMDGLVTAVNAEVGEYAGTSALISLADMNSVEVQVYIDESDYPYFVVGKTAEITFDALSGQTFTGVVTQVNPTLVTVQGSSEVEGLVSLDQKKSAGDKDLTLNMTASVEVIYQQVKNAIQVSSAALHDYDGSTATVYVLNILGIPEKRTVQLGMQGTAFTEVKSGLSVGDRVITSDIMGQ